MDRPDGLEEYRRKRRFERTPEPAGAPVDESSDGRFVVQEHHARRLHWDLRLEHDGVLVSWALPRGFPVTTEKNRLAVHTEDHPVEYLDFEGEIPTGEYGGGTMHIWDRGTYQQEKFRDREVIVWLHGGKVQGRFVLFRTHDKNWMIHRMDGPPENWEPTPEVEPLQPVPGELPGEESEWGFEVQWDGMRVIAYAEPGHLALVDESGEDVTRAFPELGRMTRSVGGRHIVLDGEVVAFDSNGRPNRELLQRRIGLRSEADIRRRTRETPVTLVLFDALYLDGESFLSLPYEERRHRLELLGLAGESWQTPGYFRDGVALLEASRMQGLPGVIAKRLDSGYESGARTAVWLKVDNTG